MDWIAVMRVLAALEGAGVDYAVIGGVAVNLHGLARGTRDIDVFVAPTAENIERLKAALRSVYDDASIDEIQASDLLGEYPAVTYAPPNGPPMDLLTRLGKAFEYADVEAERYDVDGQLVRVATPRTLYRMKRGTVRPLDHADAAWLARTFELDAEEP
jgi:hypothetical protein